MRRVFFAPRESQLRTRKGRRSAVAQRLDHTASFGFDSFGKGLDVGIDHLGSASVAERFHQGRASDNVSEHDRRAPAAVDLARGVDQIINGHVIDAHHFVVVIGEGAVNVVRLPYAFLQLKEDRDASEGSISCLALAQCALRDGQPVSWKWRVLNSLSRISMVLISPIWASIPFCKSRSEIN